MLSKFLKINETDLHKAKSPWSTFKNAYLRKKNIKSFWDTLDKKNLSKDIIRVTDQFISSESYNWTSKFWRHCIINHYKHMANSDPKIDPLHVILRLDYAGFSFLDDFSVNECLEELNADVKLNLDLFKKHDGLSVSQSMQYNMVLLILYEKIKSKKIFNNYDYINTGLYKKYNPFLTIDGKIITQQLLISLLEFEKIKTLISNSKNKVQIIELGAGYGRTANMILSLMDNVKYVVADLPPSVYFAHKNLKEFFPNKKIIEGYNIDNKNDLLTAYEKSDVLFIFPHQLKFFSDKTFDVSLSIGNLCEMEKAQIKNYMNIFEKISKNIYIKVWEISGLPFSFYKYYSVHNNNDYEIKKIWKEHFKDRCLMPTNQFELGYEF